LTKSPSRTTHELLPRAQLFGSTFFSSKNLAMIECLGRHGARVLSYPGIWKNYS